MTPNDLPGVPKEVLQVLLVEDPGGWSAVSLASRERAVVIYNPRHSKARQASDIAHELAHFILSHQPSKLVVSPDGQIVMRSYNSSQEEEANWLGWSLLLPREALLHAGRQRMSMAEIANVYEVSEPLVAFRMRITGVQLLQERTHRSLGERDRPEVPCKIRILNRAQKTIACCTRTLTFILSLTGERK